MKERKCFMITFGLGGHGMELESLVPCAPCSPYSHLSGYSTPETFKFTEYEKFDLEGCVVIDKREVLDKNPGLAVSMPMCGHETKKFNPDDISEMMMFGLQGEFKTLAQLAKTGNFSGLDFVSPELYAELWRQHGARIGKVEGDKIVWEGELPF